MSLTYRLETHYISFTISNLLFIYLRCVYCKVVIYTYILFSFVFFLNYLTHYFVLCRTCCCLIYICVLRTQIYLIHNSLVPLCVILYFIHVCMGYQEKRDACAICLCWRSHHLTHRGIKSVTHDVWEKGNTVSRAKFRLLHQNCTLNAICAVSD